MQTQVEMNRVHKHTPFRQGVVALGVVFDLVGVLGVDSVPAQAFVGPGKQRKPSLIKMVQILADGAESQSWRGVWPSVPRISAVLSPYPLEKIPHLGVKAS